MRRLGALLLAITVAVFSVGMKRVVAEAPPNGFQSLKRVTLSNGLVAMVGRPKRTALFSELLLVVRAATGTPAYHQQELAWIAAEALTAGRLSAADGSVRRELARLGVSLDFAVGREVTVFRFAVPTPNTAHLLHLLANLLGRRTLSEEDWEDALARRDQELAREEADPWERATSQLTALIWSSGRATYAGPKLILNRPEVTDRRALAAFWVHAYAPGNMVLSVWGESQTGALAEVVQREFGRLTSGQEHQAVVLPTEPILLRGGRLRCIQQEGAFPAAILMGVGTEVESDRVFYAWQIATHILGASYSSRLQRRLQAENREVYTVEAADVPIGARGMILRVSCQTEEIETTRRIILQELFRLRNEPVTNQELDLARALLRSRLKLDSPSFRDQFYRRSLAMLSSQDRRDPSKAEAILAGFTPKILLDVLQQTLKPEEASTVIVSTHYDPLCEASHETP